MRNLKFLMIVLAVSVLVFSGCGGSKDSEESSEGGDTDIPNNTPDTYNTAYVLSGRWDVIDQSVTVDADYTNDTTLSLTLSTASLTFADTQITGTRGLSTITLHETWNAYIDADVRVYFGLVAVNLDDQVMSLIKQGADNWRCEVLDTYKTVMNIEILAENLIKLTEHRIAPVSGDVLIEYDNELTFRKKE
ncbi:MAG: hypothetical protein IJT02_00410 [Synergistaceae bacterium]|nr:hypothetical protein [Synergistaceae bacterium]